MYRRTSEPSLAFTLMKFLRFLYFCLPSILYSFTALFLSLIGLYFGENMLIKMVTKTALNFNMLPALNNRIVCKRRLMMCINLSLIHI